MMDLPIGQLALERGWVSKEQLDAALARQQEIAASEPNRFRRVGHLLVKQGALSPTQVVELLAEQGIAIYRSVGSGRQYNVHQADAAQTYLSPEDSSPMEPVPAEQVRKVLVVDDINRGAKSRKAPVQRMIAPPGALQAEAQQQAAPPPPVAPKPTDTSTPRDAAASPQEPTMEELLAGRVEPQDHPQAPEPGAMPEPPAQPPQEEVAEPPLPDLTAPWSPLAGGEDDDDSEFLSGYEQQAAEEAAHEEPAPPFDVDVGAVPAPPEPPALFGQGSDEQVSAVEDDDGSDVNIFAPREGLGGEVVPPPGANDDEDGLFAGNNVDRSDVDLDLSALSPKGARKAEKSPREALFPPLEEEAANDPAAPPEPPEFPAATTASPSPDADDGILQMEIESLADGDLRSPGLDELQAPAEDFDYETDVPEPDAFPDLAPGSASVDYAVDDAPAPQGSVLGESLIDGGLSRPDGGFGLPAEEPAPPQQPVQQRDVPISVSPLDDSDDAHSSAARDESGEEPMPADSGEVRRVTGSFDRTSKAEPQDAHPLDDLDDLDDDELL